MVIQHNISAINSHRNLGINNSATSKNLEKLSSGFRINRAGDDAAGLAMAEQNASNGVSLIQTAEGGLNETHAILQRMRELSVQSSNGTYTDEDRAQLDLEFQAVKSEIDRISSSTHYNGIKLLDGTTGGWKADGTNNATEIKAAFGTSSGVDAQVITLDDAALEALGFSAADAGKTINVSYVISDTTGTAEHSLQIGDKMYKIDGTDIKDSDGNVVAAGAFGTAVETDLDKISKGTINFSIELSETGGTLDTSTTTFASDEDFMVAGKNAELVFQIGANGGADQRVGLHVDNMSSAHLGSAEGLVRDIDLKNVDNANTAIEVLEGAINQVSSQRAGLGALQNRLEHTINNLGVTKENLTAAESTIRDVDMAKEMMEFTKNNILVQASQAMLAQANQLPQGVLSLLR